MISRDAESIIDEINALRNDLVEYGGINDELTKIRKLLESINFILQKNFLQPAAEFNKENRGSNDAK